MYDICFAELYKLPGLFNCSFTCCIPESWQLYLINNVWSEPRRSHVNGGDQEQKHEAQTTGVDQRTEEINAKYFCHVLMKYFCSCYHTQYCHVMVITHRWITNWNTTFQFPAGARPTRRKISPRLEISTRWLEESQWLVASETTVLRLGHFPPLARRAAGRRNDWQYNGNRWYLNLIFPSNINICPFSSMGIISFLYLINHCSIFIWKTPS